MAALIASVSGGSCTLRILDKQVIHPRAAFPGPWEPHFSSHLQDTLEQSLTLCGCALCPPLPGGLVSVVSKAQALCN